MSCSCLNALLAALQPPWGLLPDLKLPPIIAHLGTAGHGLSTLSAMASASACAQLSAALALSLPPLPIPPVTLAAAAGLVATAGQLKSGLGIDIFSASASAQISAMLDLFGLIPFPTLPNVAPFSMLCSTLLMVKASLGVDLLMPSAAVSLQASLNAMATLAASLNLGAPAGHLALLAQYSVVANLSAALGVGLDFHAMMAKLQLVANLKVGGVPGGLGGLLQFLAALLAAKKLFGFSPFTLDASAKLALALEPLKLLANVTMSESLMAAAGHAGAMGGINFSANFSAIAKVSANMALMANLKLPSLAPVSLVAAVSAQARGMSSCSSSCPIGI